MSFNIDDTAIQWNFANFDPERPIPFVKDCGKSFADVKNREEIYALRTELTEAEKQSKYAKYYYMGLATPPEDVLKHLEYGKPMNKEDAFMISDYTKYMDVKGSNPVKAGYCILDNGVGYATSCIMAPGVTKEMVANFALNYNPPEDLYYKTWFPGAHVRHYDNTAIEDVGFGMVQVQFIEVLNAQSVGMSIPGMNDEYCIGVFGGNTVCWPLHQPDAEPIYAAQLCCFRLTPEGFEERMTFWMGALLIDGKEVIKLPHGKPVDEFLAFSLAKHSAWETATQMRNILEFAKDCGI